MHTSLNLVSIKSMAMSPKSQQDRGKSASSSRSSSLSKASRKARRARDQAHKKTEDVTAGPSGTSRHSVVAEAGPSTTVNERQDAATASFTADEDFVGFTFSDEEENEEEVEETVPQVREWDRGKGKARDYESGGRKRGHDEIDYNDGYANKKQRTDAASRLAPWAADVEWDKCNNVAEMYVPSS